MTSAMLARMAANLYAAISVPLPITCSVSMYHMADTTLFLSTIRSEISCLLREIEDLVEENGTQEFLLFSYPAVDPTDIPNGEWLCYACRCAPKRELLDGSKGSEKKKKSALEVLALAASLVNPREFELPKELQLPIMFPGSNKMDYVSGRRGKQLSSSYNNGRQSKVVTRILPSSFLFCFISIKKIHLI